MAYLKGKTDHSGPKRSAGAHAGTKYEAKRDSKKNRRRNSQADLRQQLRALDMRISYLEPRRRKQDEQDLIALKLLHEMKADIEDSQ